MTLRTALFYIEFIFYIHEIRRSQDLSAAYDVLVREDQEVYAHETRSLTRESIPTRPAIPT